MSASPSPSVGQPNSLAAAIHIACVHYAAQPALTCLGSDISYRQLDMQAETLAQFFSTTWGLKKGDRLAIMLPNIPQFVVAFYAAQKLGVICVNTNPLYTPREMKHQFHDAGVKAIVILDMLYDKFSEIVAETDIKNVLVTRIPDFMPFPKSLVVKGVMRFVKKQWHAIPPGNHTWSDAMAFSARTKTLPDVESSDIALLQYTGGTTGVAKGAMLTQSNILANVDQIRQVTSGTLTLGKETVLTALPLYHIFSLTVNMLAFLTQGHRLILVPKPSPIGILVEQFAKYPVSVMTGVNTLFNSLVASKEFRDLPNKNIRIAIAGGMALQDTVAKQWLAATGHRILQGYGLTEASPVTHITPLNQELPAGTIGTPLPGTKAKLIADDGTEVGLDTPGELLVQGPQVMQGYWNMADETANVLKNGWLHTGDIAKVDKDGLYYIVDRKKEMIVVSGFKVFPNEVEDVIAAYPKVLEVAVIGVPARSTGEAVKAFVVKRDPSCTAEEIKRYCEQNLTGYKRPRVIEFRESLPKSIIGKILRKDLKIPGEKGVD